MSPPLSPRRARRVVRRRSPSERSRPTSNELIALLPHGARVALTAKLVTIRLELDEVVATAGVPMRWVYFPDSAVLSLIAVMADGSAAEAGTVGHEGMVGLPVFLGVGSSPLTCFVQVSGIAHRVRADVFRRLTARHPALREVLQSYTHAYLCQLAQTAACNALHPLYARCARWILMTDDRVRADDHAAASEGFTLNQQSLAYMLGVRREGVSGAARRLRAAGLIHYARGRMTVIDRPGLEAMTCECYDAVRAEHARVMR
jgi:CRP-like cAMP-binding protein